MHDKQIVLVEDDTDLRESLMDCLTQSGLRAASADSALAFYRLLATHGCDIAILDLGLPDEDGLSIARFLRKERPRTGIILLTARSAVAERVSGYRTGADIYMTKPVEYGELEAAILSLARRLGTRPDGSGIAANADLWALQRQGLRLVAPNTIPVALTHQEYRLINVFAAAGEAIVPRNTLLDALGYAQDDAGHRSLNAVLVRLRAKVEQTTGQALPIQTIRGQGYLAHNLHEA